MTLRSLIAFGILVAFGCRFGGQSEPMEHANELIGELSPYLRQHAHNPVDWHAWNPENLKAAAQLGRPLLISIGYSSCHWCHVMEHESFEDEEVAEYMNAHFYCIKVDREERPDVDEFYMSAAQLITGRGGWPLNCFAFPDGSPFHAGTYYPKDRWLTVLRKVVEQYEAQPDALRAYANRLLTGLRLQTSVFTDSEDSLADPGSVVRMVDAWRPSFDPMHGGTSGAPKFPLPSGYALLMRVAALEDRPELDAHVQLSLDRMALGGIHDHLGGGFARYTVDNAWVIPHFEKMLYDNAQLLEVYAMAYQRYGKPLYKEVVEGIVAWLEREMKDPSGLYRSALDADSDNEEGLYYVWTLTELEELLGNDYVYLGDYFDLSHRSHWEDGKYVLQRTSASPADERMRTLLDRMFAQRGTRTAPGLDHKCLGSWNGLLLSGLCKAYEAFGNQRYLDLARALALAIEQHLIVKGELRHAFADGQAYGDRLLEDYAHLGWAYLSLYSQTGLIVDYQRSVLLAEAAIEQFYSSSNGLFYLHAENELPMRTAQIHDNALPAPQAVVSRLLYRLGLLDGRSDWMQMGEQAGLRMQAKLDAFPAGNVNWAQLLLDLHPDFMEVVITGPEADVWAQDIQHLEYKNCMLVFSRTEADLPFLRNRLGKHTRAFVCHKGRCDAPLGTLEDLRAVLRTASR